MKLVDFELKREETLAKIMKVMMKIYKWMTSLTTQWPWKREKNKTPKSFILNMQGWWFGCHKENLVANLMTDINGVNEI